MAKHLILVTHGLHFYHHEANKHPQRECKYLCKTASGGGMMKNRSLGYVRAMLPFVQWHVVYQANAYSIVVRTQENAPCSIGGIVTFMALLMLNLINSATRVAEFFMSN